VAECTHLDQIKSVKPRTRGCEECLKMGDNITVVRILDAARESARTGRTIRLAGR